jgi:hypothetical protein
VSVTVADEVQEVGATLLASKQPCCGIADGAAEATVDPEERGDTFFTNQIYYSSC